jgi:hypothetical protein
VYNWPIHHVSKLNLVTKYLIVSMESSAVQEYLTRRHFLVRQTWSRVESGAASCTAL